MYLLDMCNDYGGIGCVPMLLKGIRDEHTDERWHAAQALATIQGEKALPVLTELATNDSNGTVRSQASDLIRDMRNVT
jgi:HEAT repeat protein